MPKFNKIHPSNEPEDDGEPLWWLKQMDFNSLVVVYNAISGYVPPKTCNTKQKLLNAIGNVGLFYMPDNKEAAAAYLNSVPADEPEVTRLLLVRHKENDWTEFAYLTVRRGTDLGNLSGVNTGAYIFVKEKGYE